MPMRDEATEAQVRAADPQSSVWLAANAGSGKTRVLTDRVARLLLAGTQPQRILCLTYTKAAASEMQNRLFRRLGRWAMLDDAPLLAELAELGVEYPLSAGTLAAARRLFARAIETPGGLKIQTIHAFCSGLLRRFPLEAGVSPDFTELEERTALQLRREVLEAMAGGSASAAMADLAGLGAEAKLDGILAALCRMTDATPAGDVAARAFGVDPGEDAASLFARAMGDDGAALIAALVPLLASGTKTDIEAGQRLKDLRPDWDGLQVLEKVCLYGKSAANPFGPKIDGFPNKGVRSGLPANLLMALNGLMQRVAEGRERRLAVVAAGRTTALHRFASAFLPRYDAAKAARGLLDFDDLISRARRLLADPSVAAWVLYRLDGGIDHVLVDEAQDTSPSQWAVIARLCEEFTAGVGARAEDRRLFVVGDKKQSIYSFQGADLETFDRMRGDLADRHAAADVPFRAGELVHSFRSSPAVLDIVDRTFEASAAAGLGGPTRHKAYHPGLPGRVDLWPPVPAPEAPDEGAWHDPVDLPASDDARTTLARTIADSIRRMIDAPTAIVTRDGARWMHEGDVLVLVRRRDRLFHELIRACKARGLAVAGADRLLLGAELAVRDILALLAFLALPDDDLSLACALRSPLFGWSEDDLYCLAQPRGEKVGLWQALRGAGERGDATARAALEVLSDLRDDTDFRRPYEMIERILVRHDGRRRLLARLGPEAADGIDALLAEALTYEQAHVPDITGFVTWMQAGNVEVKRRADSAAGAIRVMTVHGAKGLEAPVVILPDTAKRRPPPSPELVAAEGTVLWNVPEAEQPSVLREAQAARRAREEAEHMRLLYVAMTRAESWLIVCAAGETGTGADSWHALVADAMARAGAAPLDGLAGGLRHQHGHWPEPDDAVTPVRDAPPELPGWVARPAPVAARAPLPLSPSGLEGEKVIAGAGTGDSEVAMARGSLVHRLLERLPDCPPPARDDLARELLAAAGCVDPGLAADVVAEAVRVLDAPHLAHLFAPGTLAEVEMSAPLPELGGRVMQGIADRLLVTPDRVLLVDFKTNGAVPRKPEEVPRGILAQMGAYAAMLAQIYPDRQVGTAVIWTRTAELMALPPNIVRAAMQQSTVP